MMGLLLLFYYFFTTGLFAIGGGLATIPFLYHIGEVTNWYSAIDVANMIAIAQSTPGPTGINMATFVGYKQFGLLGSVVGPFSIVLPSVIIVLLISKILDQFRDSTLVQSIFYGLRPASAGMVLAAAFEVIRISLFIPERAWSWEMIRFPAVLLALLVFGLYQWKKWHPIVLISFAAICGIIFKI